MSNRSDQMAMAYDPFGEPVAVACDGKSDQGKSHGPSAAGDRRARNVAVIGFWTVAASLTAVRIYFAEEPVAQMVANAHAQAAAFISAIL